MYGSSLFFAFMNDLPDEVNSAVRLFADDTKLYSEVRTVQHCNAIQDGTTQ